MADLAFDFEWVDPEGARGPELRATWARLTVRAAGDVVTRVFDERTRSVRESIYVSLYPIAEWIALSWWRLLYEVHSPGLSSRNGYESRHCLAQASEGFALPVLSFEPMGETLRLSWAGKRLSQAPLEFVSRGSVFLSREAVLDALRGFVDAVLGRLEDEGVEETLLHEEWQAIRDLEPDEESFCRLAAALGLDPFQVVDEEAEALLTAAEQIPAELQEEFFSATEPSVLIEEAAALGKTLEEVTGAHERLEALRALRERFAASRSIAAPPWRALELAPWKQGYAAARALRAHLGLDGSPLASFDSIGKALGVTGRVLENEIRSARGLVTVDGVVAIDDKQRPGFAVRAVAEEARRFSFCRELFEYLTAGNAAPLIVTRGGTHRQQRNRAFAAEFLLPSAALQARVPAEIVTYEKVNDIADEFGVSWAVVSHQLDNHQIARVIPD